MIRSKTRKRRTAWLHDPDDPRGGGGPGGDAGAYPGGDNAAGPVVEIGRGGYVGRDPKTDMPAVPSAPETQDDPERHLGVPSPKDHGVSLGAPFGHDTVGRETAIHVEGEPIHDSD
jgi:hypothetical protein